MSKAGPKRPGPSGAHRDVKPSNILGLRAFEKISAVEGVRLSDEMRRDVQEISGRRMSGAERTRFITGKYGKN